MKIVCDQHIPFLVEAVHEHWADVQISPMKPSEIDASVVRDSDVLVVRTRTQVNQSLLTGSQVKLVCTATIGFDHIDTAYCASQGIAWASCPGCNAQAVCDYIEEAIDEYVSLDSPFASHPYPLTVGVVGVGHVGSLVAQMAERKGWQVLLNDPPKHIGVSLDSIGKTCDIITFHTPLDASTYHLCNEQWLQQCKNGALIINAARGGVVDELALLRSGHPYILDCWENEPQINCDVLRNAFRVSMHIAGYSLQGKITATQMCLDAIASRFYLPPIALPMPQKGEGDSATGWLQRISQRLKSAPLDFENLRQNYILR